MREIKIIARNLKNNLKLINVINRAKAYSYSFGLDIKVIEDPKIKQEYFIDFDETNLSPNDIKKYSAICSQVSSIILYSFRLWDLTLLCNRPEDGLSEIQKTKRKVQASKKEDENYFRDILSHYDNVWYLREILGKSEYEPDDRINWNLNKAELSALKGIIPQIRDKLNTAGIEWNKENAINSVDAFLTASVKFPITQDFKRHFTLRLVNSSFLKIYRHVRTRIQPTGQDAKFDSIDKRFDRYFAERE